MHTGENFNHPRKVSTLEVELIKKTPEYNVPHKLDRKIRCKISFQNVV